MNHLSEDGPGIVQCISDRGCAVKLKPLLGSADLLEGIGRADRQGLFHGERG